MKSSESILLADKQIIEYIEDKVSKLRYPKEVVPRLTGDISKDEVIESYKELKHLLQHVEWLDSDTYSQDVLEYVSNNNISIVELCWAMEMFCLNPPLVAKKL